MEDFLRERAPVVVLKTQTNPVVTRNATITTNDSKHANIPKETLGESRHAPAEQRTSQQIASQKVAAQYVEEVDQKEGVTDLGEANDVDMAEKGEKRKDVWDDIMGQPGWRENDEEPQIHMWFNSIRNIVGEVTAVEEGRNAGVEQMSSSQGKRLWKECKGLVATMVRMMRLMADSKLETNWMGISDSQRAALLEWELQGRKKEERNIKMDLLEPMAQGVCILVADKPGASPKQMWLAEKQRKRAEEEKKEEEKRRQANKGLSAAQKGIAKMEKEKQEEDEGMEKARSDEQ